MLTVKQADILKALADLGEGAHGPTKIGEKCGKLYFSASSWASGGIKILMRRGYVRRFKEGAYQLTTAGEDAVKALRN